MKSNNNNLLNYFICDHKDLPKNYVKKSEKFLKSITDKQNKAKLIYPTDFEVINSELILLLMKVLKK